MYDHMVEMRWLALPHCPPGQLSKPKEGTDAGYDLMVADDIYVPTIQELDEEGSYTWEEIGELKSFSPDIQNKIMAGVEIEEFLVESSGNKLPTVSRKKFKFPLARTGVCIKPDTLMWNAIYSRSGTSTKYNVSLANSVGVIDFKP